MDKTSCELDLGLLDFKSVTKDRASCQDRAAKFKVSHSR